jgi:Protein of unknown function (DUF541)
MRVSARARSILLCARRNQATDSRFLADWPDSRRQVEDEVADFRSLTYSLADEEAAKKQAVAEAMRRAIGRASIALEQKQQKLGGLRYMSLDVKQRYGVARFEAGAVSESVEVNRGISGLFTRDKVAPPSPLPPSQPEKITLTATVQCALQIQ